jgi:DNA-binding protein H-NS
MAMSSPTYNELQQQIAALQQQAAAVRKAEISTVLAEIRAQMAAYNITAADIAGGAPKRTYGTVAAKYRNPQTGDTWSGRGKHPRWLAQALLEGKTLADFAIKSE